MGWLDGRSTRSFNRRSFLLRVPLEAACAAVVITVIAVLIDAPWSDVANIEVYLLIQISFFLVIFGVLLWALRRIWSVKLNILRRFKVRSHTFSPDDLYKRYARRMMPHRRLR